MVKILSGLSGAIVVSFAFQEFSPLPDGIAGFLGNMPFIAVLVWIMIDGNKRQKEENQRNREYLEHMLELQSKSYAVTFEVQKSLVERLISQIEALTHQVAVNTATVGEIAKIDEVLGLLIDDRAGGK